MTIKPLSKFGYQTFPIVDGMIEVSAEDLQAISNRTKCFNADLTDIIPYEKPQPTAEEIEAKYKADVVFSIRAHYTADDEIAILRQKEEKPLEYQAYFDYCEECKNMARNFCYGGKEM